MLKQRWVIALLAVLATAGAIWYYNKMKKDGAADAAGTTTTDTKTAPKTAQTTPQKMVNPNSTSAASLTAIRLR